jgi:hypothetical protein
VAIAQSPFEVRLFEQNDSGETGLATLTDLGNGMLRVDVTVENAPEGVSQTMHIHEGTCADLDPAPKYPLTSLVDGASTTEIEATLDTLVASPHAINGHKSAAEASVYVFCGDIIQGIVQATTEATEEATTEATAEATEEATTEATEEATSEATEQATAEATVTEEATTSAEATATPVMTLPGTGSDTPWNGLVLIAIVGAAVLLLGLYMRRTGRGA